MHMVIDDLSERCMGGSRGRVHTTPPLENHKWLKYGPPRSLGSNCFSKEVWPRGYKTFFMLNSAEHEIYPAHNVKMPTSVDILTLISMINTISERLKAKNSFICWYFSFNAFSADLSMKFFITLDLYCLL